MNLNRRKKLNKISDELVKYLGIENALKWLAGVLVYKIQEETGLGKEEAISLAIRIIEVLNEKE